MSIDTLKQAALADLIADAAILYANGHATDWQEVAKQALAALTPGQEANVEHLKQAALDHLEESGAASFLEPLEDGKWLCVGTKESIARLVGAARPELTNADITRAAKVMCERLDYPWEHMLDQGRALMRQHAREVVDAALATPPQAKEE